MRRAHRVQVLVTALVTGAVVAACGSSGGAGSPSQGPSTGTPGSATRLQKALDAWVSAAGLVGATAAVVTPSDRWSGASGLDGAGTALVADSALPIASVTKTVTGAEVMLLAHQGLVDLDAPVARYVRLPWDARGATVRDLLGMRSGFPVLDDEVLLPRVEKDLTARWTDEQLVALVDPSGPRLGTAGAAPTGDLSGWYNSMNFDVLALLIEKVTGTSAGAAVRRDLLGPLGLVRMWWQPEERPAPPLATTLDAADHRLTDPSTGYLPSTAWGSAMGGGGCMAADAATLAAWGAALYEGKALPPTVVAQMTAGAADDGYGLATMRVQQSDGTVLVGHLGDAGVAGSLLLHWPTDHVTVVVLVPQQVGAPPPTFAFALELARIAGAA